MVLQVFNQQNIITFNLNLPFLLMNCFYFYTSNNLHGQHRKNLKKTNQKPKPTNQKKKPTKKSLTIILDILYK